MILPLFIFLFAVTKENYPVFASILFIFNMTYLANHINLFCMLNNRFSVDAKQLVIFLDMLFIAASSVLILLYACQKISFEPVLLINLLATAVPIILVVMKCLDTNAFYDLYQACSANDYNHMHWYCSGIEINGMIRIGLMLSSLFLFKFEKAAGTETIQEQKPASAQIPDDLLNRDSTCEVAPERIPETDSFFKYRGVGACIFLGLITFGIYWIYWLSTIVRQIKDFHGDDSPATGEVLLYLFIPFYNWYWGYTRGKQLYNDSWKIYGNMPDRSGTYLLLSILNLQWIVLAMIQSKMNYFSVRRDER